MPLPFTTKQCKNTYRMQMFGTFKLFLKTTLNNQYLCHTYASHNLLLEKRNIPESGPSVFFGASTYAHIV